MDKLARCGISAEFAIISGDLTMRVLMAVLNSFSVDVLFSSSLIGILVIAFMTNSVTMFSGIQIFVMSFPTFHLFVTIRDDFHMNGFSRF